MLNEIEKVSKKMCTGEVHTTQIRYRDLVLCNIKSDAYIITVRGFILFMAGKQRLRDSNRSLTDPNRPITT